MHEQVLEQSVSLFLNAALQKISGYIDDINDALDYFLDHFEKGIDEDWPRRSLGYIREDIKDVDVLLEKVTAVVALQAALEKICEIDAKFDK